MAGKELFTIPEEKNSTHASSPFGGYDIRVLNIAIEGNRLGDQLVELIKSYNNKNGNELLIGTTSKMATLWTSNSYGLDIAHYTHSILLYEKNSKGDQFLELRADFTRSGYNSGENREKKACARNHITIGKEAKEVLEKRTCYTEKPIEDILKEVYETAFNKKFSLPLKDEHLIIPNIPQHQRKARLINKLGGSLEDYLLARLYILREQVDLDPDDWDTRYIHVARTFAIPELNKTFAFQEDDKVIKSKKISNNMSFVPAELVRYAGFFGRAVDYNTYRDFVMPKQINAAIKPGKVPKQEIEQLKEILSKQLIREPIYSKTLSYYLGNDI